MSFLTKYPLGIKTAGVWFKAGNDRLFSAFFIWNQEDV